MRVAIDGRYIHDRFPGIGRYVFNLIRHLAGVAPDCHFVVFHNPALPNSRHPMAALARLSNVEIIPSACATPSLAEQWRIPLASFRKRVDLLHAPYYVRPYLMPAPVVTTVYDVISAHYPEHLPSWRARLAFHLSTRMALATSRRVLTLSKCSREDLTQLYGVPAQQVAVTYPAADEHYRPVDLDRCRATRQRYGLPQRFALFVGINKPHKNLLRLIEAVAMARRQADVRLVVAGPRDPRHNEAREAVERLGLSGAVQLIGEVPEVELPLLYNAAEVFAFPSLYEGFGLPPLEAMACGLPVICSNRSSLPEVTGDAAMLLDPCDVSAWSKAIVELWDTPAKRAELRNLGLARASTFSWRKTAVQTLAAYHEALRS